MKSTKFMLLGMSILLLSIYSLEFNDFSNGVSDFVLLSPFIAIPLILYGFFKKDE